MKKSDILQWTWELPQNIVGRVMLSILKATPYTKHETATVYAWKLGGGISLGNYIFIAVDPATNPDNKSVQKLIKHEYGHTIQSRYLGWLYLIVIGLPSLVWASCFKDFRKKTAISYYSFYTERWADKLGGVDR